MELRLAATPFTSLICVFFMFILATLLPAAVTPDAEIIGLARSGLVSTDLLITSLFPLCCCAEGSCDAWGPCFLLTCIVRFRLVYWLRALEL